jgi:heat-inducible transcriptional repressor
MDLTERQKNLLRSVIEKYIETGEPVGSETLEKEASLGVSPATIRNEMVRLTALGYLRQPHTSAGRIPTSIGMKFYVDQLMEERSLSLKDEVAIKEELKEDKSRDRFDKLLRHTAQVLADQTHSLALATEDNEGGLYTSGMANILDLPEFYDIDITRTVLSMLDRAEMLADIFGRLSPEDQIKILFGDELGVPYLEPCGFVLARYRTPNHHGVLGVIGPTRLNYSSVIPTMRYFSQLLSEI